MSSKKICAIQFGTNAQYTYPVNYYNHRYGCQDSYSIHPIIQIESLFVRSYRLKRFLAIFSILPLFVNASITPAKADITWSQVSIYDTLYDGKIYNSQYDLDYSSVYIFDNDTDFIYFYLEFKNLPKVNMFNDGLDSFAFIGLDYNLDKSEDIRLGVQNVTLKTDRSSVTDYAYDWRIKKYTSCQTYIFTNIDDGSKWVGIEVPGKCLGLPYTFDMYAYAEYNDKNSSDSYDYAPYPYMRVNLLSSSGSSGSSTGNS